MLNKLMYAAVITASGDRTLGLVPRSYFCIIYKYGLGRD